MTSPTHTDFACTFGWLLLLSWNEGPWDGYNLHNQNLWHDLYLQKSTPSVSSQVHSEILRPPSSFESWWEPPCYTQHLGSRQTQEWLWQAHFTHWRYIQLSSFKLCPHLTNPKGSPWSQEPWSQAPSCQDAVFSGSFGTEQITRRNLLQYLIWHAIYNKWGTVQMGSGTLRDTYFIRKGNVFQLSQKLPQSLPHTPRDQYSKYSLRRPTLHPPELHVGDWCTIGGSLCAFWQLWIRSAKGSNLVPSQFLQIKNPKSICKVSTYISDL